MWYNEWFLEHNLTVLPLLSCSNPNERLWDSSNLTAIAEPQTVGFGQVAFAQQINVAWPATTIVPSHYCAQTVFFPFSVNHLRILIRCSARKQATLYPLQLHSRLISRLFLARFFKGLVFSQRPYIPPHFYWRHCAVEHYPQQDTRCHATAAKSEACWWGQMFFSRWHGLFSQKKPLELNTARNCFKNIIALLPNIRFSGRPIQTAVKMAGMKAKFIFRKCKRTWRLHFFLMYHVIGRETPLPI